MKEGKIGFVEFLVSGDRLRAVKRSGLSRINLLSIDLRD